MDYIPKIKKKISSFLIKEDGKITKEKLLKTGIILGGIALVSAKFAAANHRNSYNTHTNDALNAQYDSETNIITATHNHHTNHSSHNSHGSHSSGW